ncbi:MAG: hypothetical protein IPM13_01995 [Phycisphaerales bacterium]|nr:hypothetical protein [Phycisphaerales bacterium]
MRIAYGIFGYGRGHATRAAAVLPELCRRHAVRLFAGGDAYDQLSPEYPVSRIPTIGYRYTRRGAISGWLTARENAWSVLDMLLRGPQFRQVCEAVADFAPDLVISDAEPWMHRAARRLGIPRIGFDHFGVMVYCKPHIPFGDRIRSRRDVLVYRWLMGKPDRIIVSSFYHAKPRWPRVRVVGPLLRDEVLAAEPSRGQHLLVYFNKGAYQYAPHIERALQASGLPCRVYGTPRQGADGLIAYRPMSNVPFVEDMASCRAIISTAGNQLVGEAVHLGKPMLVMPEQCVEQRLNAASLERRGFGRAVRWRDFSVDHLQAFLAEEERFHAHIRCAARNGRREAVEAIESFIAELGHRGTRSGPPAAGERRASPASADNRDV